MPIKINHDAAKRVLYEEYDNHLSGISDDLTEEWKSRIDKLGELCPYRKSATFVAALGTAILAKTVEANVDVYCILDRDGGERSYSARSLADNVWAKNRAYLGVDLGANNANPLNNTPFVGRARIDQIENVRNKAGFAYLRLCLDALQQIENKNSARSALRGFIASRIVTSIRSFKVGEEAGDYFIIQSLAGFIEWFVNTDSEEGRRAQGVAAGLLSVAFGEEYVDVGHVNDPDRHFPLDVSVYDNPKTKSIRFSVEVKDKKISGSDALSSVEKAAAFDVHDVLYLALAKNQENTSFFVETERARDLGCKLIFYFSWEQFCKMCFSVTGESGPAIIGKAYRIIGDVLVSLGVSQEGIDQWSGGEKDTK